MLLDIDIEVFETGDQPSVIALLRMVGTGRHDWRPSLPAALVAQRFLTANLPNDPTLLEAVRHCFVESANPIPPFVGLAPVSAKRLREVLEDLGRPAAVVVEDGLNEECFLLAVAAAFGRTRITQAHRQTWLKFVHAGGKDRLAQFTEREVKDFQVLVRVVAVLDSDRTVPRQRTPNHTYGERVLALGVAAHVWAWRELENYVPVRVWLAHFPGREEKIGMLAHMRPDQRGHLDIKNGLGDQPEAAVVALFADLPAEVRQAWRTGLRRRRGGMPSPVVPDGLALTERDFAELGPDTVAELKDVLAMIEQIL